MVPTGYQCKMSSLDARTSPPAVWILVYVEGHYCCYNMELAVATSTQSLEQVIVIDRLMAEPADWEEKSGSMAVSLVHHSRGQPVHYT